MKPLDYLGFLVDLPPVAWVFTNPIQSWEWPCWVLVKGQRLGPSLKHEPRMSFSRKWWVRVPDSHPRNEYVWGYIGYFTKQIGHVCTGNHPPRQRIINIVKWPKCEMHLNATLMSPNLGNKKIVYRQNITDTSNIYIYVYIHSRIIYTIMLWSRSWAPRAPISRNDVRICIIVKMMYTHISKLTALYLFFFIKLYIYISTTEYSNFHPSTSRWRLIINPRNPLARCGCQSRTVVVETGEITWCLTCFNTICIYIYYRYIAH